MRKGEPPTPLPRPSEEIVRIAHPHLVQAERLSILGELIGDVLHELNNPLAAIRGFAQLLLMQDLPPQAKEDLERIHEGVEDALQILRNFLEFARQQPPQHIPVAVNDLVRRLLELRAYGLRSENIEVKLDLDPSLPPAEADPQRLGQALMSLVLNAEHAMSHAYGEGTLCIRTHSPDGQRVRIEIADDGPGIPQEFQEAIFTPFFSTKGGAGTGLGLPFAVDLVSEMKGKIWFETNASPDQGPTGTTFFVELPAAHTEAARPPQARTRQTPGAPTSWRVLVMDDEEGIRELIRRTLNRQGHHVDTASDGETGLEKAIRQVYDAILCDLHMSGLTGRGFHERLREVDPRLAERIIFMTGSVLDTETEAMLEEMGAPNLVKPFELKELLAAVEQVAHTAGGTTSEE